LAASTRAQHNKALHWTGVPLRFTPASELCRYAKLPEEHLLQEQVIKDDTQSVQCLLKLLGES